MLVYQENRTMCRPGLNSAMQAQFPDALCRSICTQWPEGKTNSRYYRNAANWVQRSPGHPRKSGKIRIFKSFYHEMYCFSQHLRGFHVVFTWFSPIFLPHLSIFHRHAAQPGLERSVCRPLLRLGLAQRSFGFAQRNLRYPCHLMLWKMGLILVIIMVV